jgi:hypothetical protein
MINNPMTNHTINCYNIFLLLAYYLIRN